MLSAGASLITSAGRVIGFDELESAIEARAEELRAGGARPGRVVAVAVKEPAAMLVASLAVWRTGAVLAPMDVRAPVDATVAFSLVIPPIGSPRVDSG